MKIIKKMSSNDTANLKVVFDVMINDYINALYEDTSMYDIEGLELLDLLGGYYEDIYDENGEYVGEGINTVYGNFLVNRDNEEDISLIFDKAKRYVLSNI